MSFVRVCPVEPVNGSCPEPMVWQEVAAAVPMTTEQFLSLVPVYAGVLFTCWGFKKLIHYFLK